MCGRKTSILGLTYKEFDFVPIRYGVQISFASAPQDGG